MRKFRVRLLILILLVAAVALVSSHSAEVQTFVAGVLPKPDDTPQRTALALDAIADNLAQPENCKVKRDVSKLTWNNQEYTQIVLADTGVIWVEAEISRTDPLTPILEKPNLVISCNYKANLRWQTHQGVNQVTAINEAFSHMQLSKPEYILYGYLYPGGIKLQDFNFGWELGCEPVGTADAFNHSPNIDKPAGQLIVAVTLGQIKGEFVEVYYIQPRDYGPFGFPYDSFVFGCGNRTLDEMQRYIQDTLDIRSIKLIHKVWRYLDPLSGWGF